MSNSIEHRQAQHANRHISDSDIVASRGRYSAIETIDTIANKSSPDESHGDVARIVDTQIEARPTIGERPTYQEDRQESLAHEKWEEQGDGECVTRMGREETIVAAAIAVDGINERANLRVMGRSPASHKRFDKFIVNSPC